MSHFTLARLHSHRIFVETTLGALCRLCLSLCPMCAATGAGRIKSTGHITIYDPFPAHELLTRRKARGITLLDELPTRQATGETYTLLSLDGGVFVPLETRFLPPGRAGHAENDKGTMHAKSCPGSGGRDRRHRLLCWPPIRHGLSDDWHRCGPGDDTLRVSLFDPALRAHPGRGDTGTGGADSWRTISARAAWTPELARSRWQDHEPYQRVLQE